MNPMCDRYIFFQDNETHCHIHEQLFVCLFLDLISLFLVAVNNSFTHEIPGDQDLKKKWSDQYVRLYNIFLITFCLGKVALNDLNQVKLAI